MCFCDTENYNKATFLEKLTTSERKTHNSIENDSGNDQEPFSDTEIAFPSCVVS